MSVFVHLLGFSDFCLVSKEVHTSHRPRNARAMSHEKRHVSTQLATCFHSGLNGVVGPPREGRNQYWPYGSSARKNWWLSGIIWILFGFYFWFIWFYLLILVYLDSIGRFLFGPLIVLRFGLAGNEGWSHQHVIVLGWKMILIHEVVTDLIAFWTEFDTENHGSFMNVEDQSFLQKQVPKVWSLYYKFSWIYLNSHVHLLGPVLDPNEITFVRVGHAGQCLENLKGQMWRPIEVIRYHYITYFSMYHIRVCNM